MHMCMFDIQLCNIALPYSTFSNVSSTAAFSGAFGIRFIKHWACFSFLTPHYVAHLAFSY